MINDDPYYDRFPKWSYNGDLIYFLSNRAGSESTLKIIGMSAPHDVYFYDFRNGIIKELSLPYQKNRPKYLRT